ncbi:hypothetical protein ACS0TY_012536 [Phlomoides rotata]
MAATASVIDSSEQAIIVHAQHSLFQCTFRFVHAASDYVSRRELWQFISGLHCTNLCLIGDFNAVLGAHERISSCAPNNISCAEFRSFIEQELLFEVEVAGSAFTWASRRSTFGLIASKLDRVLAHEGFIDHWDSVSATVLARAGLDHHPLLLHCAMGPLNIVRPFKFQSTWTLDYRFRKLVDNSWNQSLISTDLVSRVIQKLKRLKQELRVWNKEVFGIINTKIAEANQVLTEVQNQVYSGGDSELLLDREIEATVDLQSILAQEQMFYAQKNRATWLKDGDRNTAFFHRLHKVKKARPGIHSMFVGNLLSTDPEAIRINIERFYVSLFSATPTAVNTGIIRELNTVILILTLVQKS